MDRGSNVVHDRPWVNRGARQGRGAAAPALTPALTLALTLALAGCGGTGPVASSVDFVHGLEGGAIAAQRPPPPGAGQPFPNLGTIPARPVPLPPSARQQVADALSVDRTLAEREAALAPLPPPAPAAAAAAAPASPQPAAPPPDANASTATMPASTPPAAPAGATPAAPPVAAIPASVASAGPPPTIPAAPPSPASIPGFAVPTEPPPLVLRLGAAPAATPVPQAAPGLVPIAFAAGSSVLPRDAYLALRALSVARHGRTIDVTGRGEAPSSLPALQAAGLQLGLERAQAIAAALNVAGVPPSAIRLHAAAAGRGGWARLVG
jgi:hypothetical protein